MKYKNINKQTQTLIGFGVIKPNGTVESKNKINNPNFKLVGEPKIESAEEPKEVRTRRYGRPKPDRETS